MRTRPLLWLCLLIWLAARPSTSSAQPTLAITLDPDRPWPRLHGNGLLINQTFTLLLSSNLTDWAETAQIVHAPFEFLDPVLETSTPRFYRLRASSPAADWANLIALPSHPFFNLRCADSSMPRWIKFTVQLEHADRVIFQNSELYPLHYDFAIARLPGFQGMSPAEFEAISTRIATQRLLLGAVLLHPSFNDWLLSSAPVQFGIQFVGRDPYPPEQVVAWFELVKSAVQTQPGSQAVYLPAHEQQADAQFNRALFESRGIQLSSLELWTDPTNLVYASGWAVGRLVFLPSDEIQPAFGDGRLTPVDILLTDQVPADVPQVSGILCLNAATPNSHAVVLAQSSGIPMAYLRDPELQDQARSLSGRNVLLDAGSVNGQVVLRDVEDILTPQDQAEILALKRPPPLEIVPKAHFGAIVANASNLVPADVQFFGGKAANYGLLRRTIPDFSLDAIAFSFDLWDRFLDQEIYPSYTLRQEISYQLSGFTWPPDITLLRSALLYIRTLIASTVQFAPADQQAILAAVARFSPERKIRFRSSTNVEDTERYTGAGLYDSFSGCLADDLDGDLTGPSRCDPDHRQEHGVLRAIQKVYASFYNENAFLERLRLQVPEDQAGMALLVHYSDPDQDEMANGVVTLRFRPADAGAFIVAGQLVSQAGAVPVTNPDGQVRPEVLDLFWSTTASNFTVREQSSLTVLGARVLAWPNDYYQLLSLLTEVGEGYAQLFPAKTDFALDFEFKKMQPGSLQVKQVRELPSAPIETNQSPPFLLGQSQSFCVGNSTMFQIAGSGSLLAVHRLKSQWQMANGTIRLESAGLDRCLFTNAQFTLAEGAARIGLAGSPTNWPGALHSVTTETNQTHWITEDRWTLGEETNARICSLITTLPRQLQPGELPLIILGDDPRATLALNVQYPSPVLELTLSLTSLPAAVWTTNDFVTLRPCSATAATNPPEWLIVSTNGVEAYVLLQRRWFTTGETPCWWTNAPPYIAPKTFTDILAQISEITLQGLTSQPLLLDDPFAFTYRGGGHHVISEEIIIDPFRQPGLSPGQKSELLAANIQLVYLTHNLSDPYQNLFLIGWDGSVRPAGPRSR